LKSDKQNQIGNCLQRRLLVYAALSLSIGGVVLASVAAYPPYRQIRTANTTALVFAANSCAVAIGEYLSQLPAVSGLITTQTKAREKLEDYKAISVTVHVAASARTKTSVGIHVSVTDTRIGMTTEQ